MKRLKEVVMNEIEMGRRMDDAAGGSGVFQAEGRGRQAAAQRVLEVLEGPEGKALEKLINSAITLSAYRPTYNIDLLDENWANAAEDVCDAVDALVDAERKAAQNQHRS